MQKAKPRREIQFTGPMAVIVAVAVAAFGWLVICLVLDSPDGFGEKVAQSVVLGPLCGLGMMIWQKVSSK